MRFKDGEVLVRVHAACVAGDDWHLMRGLPFVARLGTGLFKPRNRVPGLDVAGHVEAVGKNANEFQQGDEVFGWCKGAFAEYVSVSSFDGPSIREEWERTRSRQGTVDWWLSPLAHETSTCRTVH